MPRSSGPKYRCDFLAYAVAYFCVTWNDTTNVRPDGHYVRDAGTEAQARRPPCQVGGGPKRNIDEIVRKVVVEQLTPAKVINLYVMEDVDTDGDPFFRIAVVFNAGKDRLDPDRVVGLTRHLRNHLDELAPERFPIFSFTTVGEADTAA